MKKGILFIALFLLATFTFSACGKESKDENEGTETRTNTEIGEENNMSEYKFQATDKVEIEVKEYGKIVVELDRNVAPITVENFMNLVEEGFYDGLSYHRVISGFMIQGGDPLGNGTGGSGEEIKGEFLENGVNNPISHTRGAISMARSLKNDSASSQFFIVHEDSQFLDGKYAAFGYVSEGIEVVDQICENTQVEDDNGTVLRENQPIITSIKVVE